jgi:DNA-binding NarL/FixJ family response regulator
MTRVYIVEDHPIMRQSLRAFIRRQEGFELCGEAESAEAALEEIDHTQPDLMLIDLSLPGMSGLELLEQIRQRYPALLCMILSGHGERSHVDHAMMAGARGYIVKGDTDELAQAMRQVSQGQTYLSELVQNKLDNLTDDK